MEKIKISKFQDIEFENVNPASDVFELPDGKSYRFSDHVCHECWSGGSVLESIADAVEYYCVVCEEALVWVEFENDFVDPKEGTISFLLPKIHTSEELEIWL